MKRIVVLLAALATLLALQGRALASHYRSGTIHWSVPGSNAPTTVLFTVTYGILAASPPPLRTVNVDFGDGTSSGPLTGSVVGSTSDAQGLLLDVLEVTTLHTYAGPGTFTAVVEDCCRIGSLVNGANETYRVSSVVTLQPGNTGGPVTGTLPVVELQLGAPRTYEWPVIDPDGDPITCRFGTDAEAGFVDSVPVVPSAGPGLGGQAPALASHPDRCQLGWDLTDATPGQKFTIHLVFEAKHDGVASSTELDLIVEIVTAPTPVCEGSGVFTADVGQALTIPLTGTHALPSPLTVSLLGAAAGATLSPGGSGPSPFQNTFSWAPEPLAAGTAHMLLIGYASAMHLTGACFLAVIVPGCPGAAVPCSAGIGECQQSGLMVCTGAGQAACNAQAKAPEMEACDGKDNDCDGEVDNGEPGSGEACSTGLPGICDAGITGCVAGAIACATVTMPGDLSETCDGEDDDCDGEVDEGLGLGETCGVGLGQCASFGVLVCAADGGTGCDAVAGEPSKEICDDNLDQDCDGVVDNGCAGAGGAGGSGGAGGAGGAGGEGASDTGGAGAGVTGGGGTGAGGEGPDDGPSAGCGTLCAMRRLGAEDAGGGVVALVLTAIFLARRRRMRVA